MKAGRMVHPLTVHRWQEGEVDAYGTPGGAWVDLATLRAELVDVGQSAGGGERGATQEAGATARVRAALSIVAGDRATVRGTLYRVSRVVEIGRARGLELTLSADLAGV